MASETIDAIQDYVRCLVTTKVDIRDINKVVKLLEDGYSIDDIMAICESLGKAQKNKSVESQVIIDLRYGEIQKIHLGECVYKKKSYESG